MIVQPCTNFLNKFYFFKKKGFVTLLIMSNSPTASPSVAAAAAVVAEVNVVSKFIPLLAVVTTTIGEIIETYQAAEYNKKICGALMDRVQIAEGVIKTLRKRKQENENNFHNK